ncbi:MAG: pyrimidine dimer DNA glycosylase/endonuclease V [Actinomycetaceae bacterium]|nr:pyrimidine dimer DNA glycosylase/endonuclease V [Actinomycetaceae bacterium]
MRLWSLHPSYLDRRALVACWRETLLAQKVLQGLTKGYRNHPQLDRFKATDDPLAAIGVFLDGLWDEATARGYHFDRSKIVCPPTGARLATERGQRDLSTTSDRPAHRTPSEIQIPVTTGQLEYEMKHLRAKVEVRAIEEIGRLNVGTGEVPKPHPLLRVVSGDVEPWEVVKPAVL